MDLTPHHIGIVVSDLDRSKAFYRALGFEQVSERVGDDKTLSFLQLGALQLELFAYVKPVPGSEVPERVLGFRHLALETRDIDATFAELRAAGVLPEGATIREIPPDWRLLFFTDPDGIEIEIKQA